MIRIHVGYAVVMYELLPKLCYKRLQVKGSSSILLRVWKGKRILVFSNLNFAPITTTCCLIKVCGSFRLAVFSMAVLTFQAPITVVCTICRKQIVHTCQALIPFSVVSYIGACCTIRWTGMLHVPGI